MFPYQYLNIINKKRVGFIKLGWIHEVLLNYKLNDITIYTNGTVQHLLNSHSASAERESGQDKQEYAIVFTAWLPQTKLLHLVHLCSHLLSSLRGHEWHRPRFFAWFVTNRLGVGCTPIANMAFATDVWCEIDGSEARCVINGCTSLSATSVRKRRRLSRRVEPLWFLHCGFFRFHTTNAFRQAASIMK